MEDAPKFGAKPPLCATTAVLGKLALRPRQTFYYLWDFGDEWWHTVKVARVFTTMPSGPNLLVLEKHGKSPNEFEQWPPGRL